MARFMAHRVHTYVHIKQYMKTYRTTIQA